MEAESHPGWQHRQTTSLLQTPKLSVANKQNTASMHEDPLATLLPLDAAPRDPQPCTLLETCTTKKAPAME